MRKKIIIGILVLVGLFVITGCGNSSNENQLTKDGKAKIEFVDLMYKEPTNFVKKEPIDVVDGMKTLTYRLDNTDENININMHYAKGKSYNYIIDKSDKYTEKEINGITWRFMHIDDFGIECDLYFVVYNNDLYQIELNGIDKKPDMSSFMDEVSFK